VYLGVLRTDDDYAERAWKLDEEAFDILRKL
jgi:hypothetical protein